MSQSWALALFFQVCSPLCAHFLTKDRYHSSAHFADFQVRSSLNRSKKQWFALGKERWNAKSLLKLQRFALLKFARSRPLPPHPVSIKYVCKGWKNCRHLAAFFSDSSSTHNLKYGQIMHFYAFFNHFYAWFALALLLILQIFRFAHPSIALKETSDSLPKKQWFALAHR